MYFHRCLSFYPWGGSVCPEMVSILGVSMSRGWISQRGWGEYPVGGYVQGWIAPPPLLPHTHMGPGIPTPLPAIDT